MRILIPVTGFGRAGGYRVLSEMANAWVRAGHAVDFLAPDTSGMPYFPTVAGIIWCDLNGLVSVGNDNRQFTPRRGWQLLVTLYRSLKNIGNDYDIVLANHSFTAWPTRFAIKNRKKTFYYIQAYEPEYYKMEKRPLGYLFSRLSYFLGLRQIVNTAVYTQHYGVSGDHVVPFGIDRKTFRPKTEVDSISGYDHITIGCIGRAEPAKGTKYVLEAFETLWANDKRFRLKVAYGNLPNDWAHEAVETVIPKNDDELAAFYRSLDILMAAGTVQHGAPHYPVLEAMASGVPVVHTGYLPGNEFNSWIARSKSSSSLAKQVKLIVAENNLTEKTKKAIQDVEPFAWDAVAQSMISCFEA